MPTAFETFVNDEIGNRIATTEATQTAGYYPRYTGTSKLTTERSPANVLSDIGAAASSHVHAAADTTSGTFNDARLGGATGTGQVVRETSPTIASPTLTAPTIGATDFSLANHNHTATTAGGRLNITGLLGLATLGQIVASNGTWPAALTVGANDTMLVADSGETVGIKWANAATVKALLGLVPSSIVKLSKRVLPFAVGDSANKVAVSDYYMIGKAHEDMPITIVRMFGEVSGVGSETADFNLYWAAEGAAQAVSTNNVASADLQATITGAEKTTGWADATIPAGSWLFVKATAVANAPDTLWGAIEYTIDD